MDTAERPCQSRQHVEDKSRASTGFGSFEIRGQAEVWYLLVVSQLVWTVPMGSINGLAALYQQWQAQSHNHIWLSVPNRHSEVASPGYRCASASHTHISAQLKLLAHSLK